jgi:hypothetical protein
VAAVDGALVNAFQYEDALMGAIRSELQEFYGHGGAVAAVEDNEDDGPEP